MLGAAAAPEAGSAAWVSVIGELLARPDAKDVPASVEAAFSHAYLHTFGVTSPLGAELAPVPALPVTSMLARPAVGLVVSVEGLAEPPVGAAPLAGGELPAVLALAAQRREGLSPASVEVVAPWLTDAAIAGPAVRWDAAVGGFALQQGGAAALPPGLTGRIACTSAGRAALAELGVRVVREGTGACPVYAVPVHGKAVVAATTAVELDAAAPDAGLALSEAALLVTLALAPPASVTLNAAGLPAGVTVHRVYATGPAAVAAARGPGSPAHVAASAALEAAVRVADRLLNAAAAPGRCVTVLLGGRGGSASRHLGADDDQFLAASGTPIPAVPRIAVTHTSNDIDAYHIVLWTSVLLGAALLAVIYVMLGMDAGRDAQLTAQIQDPRAAAAAHRRT